MHLGLCLGSFHVLWDHRLFLHVLWQVWMSFVLIFSDLSLFHSSINVGTFYTWRNWGAERISFFIFFCPYVHSWGTLTLFQGFISHLGICADGIHILKVILPTSSGLQIQGLFLWDASVVFCCLVSRVWLFCNPMDCSPPGSSLHGVLQARILEWFAMPCSRGSSQPRHRTCVSYIGGRVLYCWSIMEACGILGLL